MSQTVKLTDAMEAKGLDTGLVDPARRQIARKLSTILADTYSLIIKTHIYHWNVTGPLFHAVHEITEEHYKDMFEAADDIAERVRALGFYAPTDGDVGPIKATVPQDGAKAEANFMIVDLIASHEELVRNMREAAEMAEEKDDFVSHDMLVERLTFHEKAIWMLRALSA